MKFKFHLLPLCADVGTQSQRQEHPLGLNEARETGQVTLAGGEVDLAALLFMEVPRRVRRDRIQAHRSESTEPVAPKMGWCPKIVKFARDELDGLAIKDEFIVRYVEATRHQECLWLTRLWSFPLSRN